jgi:Zn-dependent protease
VDLSGLNIPLIAIKFVLLLLSLTVHEMAHAWSASHFGDQTARLLGRVSLNPLPHIDPIGTVLFPRPVPVNPANLKRPRFMMMWISAAGPLSNLALAGGFLTILAVSSRAGLAAPSVHDGGLVVDLSSIVFVVLVLGFFTNVMLAFFNLLPIPPLDGGGVLAGLLPQRMGEAIEGFGRFGFLMLMALILIPVGPMNLLSWILHPVIMGAQLALSLSLR